jgi:hypothetical protein
MMTVFSEILQEKPTSPTPRVVSKLGASTKLSSGFLFGNSRHTCTIKFEQSTRHITKHQFTQEWACVEENLEEVTVDRSFLRMKSSRLLACSWRQQVIIKFALKIIKSIYYPFFRLTEVAPYKSFFTPIEEINEDLKTRFHKELILDQLHHCLIS